MVAEAVRVKDGGRAVPGAGASADGERKERASSWLGKLPAVFPSNYGGTPSTAP